MIRKVLLIIGVVCLGVYAYLTLQARRQQEELESELFKPRAERNGPAPRRDLKEGDLFGRLEIPRLNMSVMVMEGVSSKTLRLGAGHIPGTEMAIAAHRDSFFRPLAGIQANDTIRFMTVDGTAEYRVIFTKIVGPKDTHVIDPEPENTMTLVTCYPFYYIGPAPKRFIVQAKKT